MIPFQQLLSTGQPVLGTWVKLPAVESVELMALAGFDFVVIDLEHSPMSLETAAVLIAVANGRGLCPLVRVPDRSPSWISRCLDAGASGVVVPHVDTVEQARAVDAAARFEPRGRRGVGPTSRAGSWGLEPIDHYLRSVDQVTVVAQVESDEALEAVPAMLRDGRVDSLFIGPVDLSVSLGKPADHPEVVDRIAGVLRQCRSASVPCGTAIGADPGRAATLGREGYSYVMVSNDATILGLGGRRLVEEFRAARSR